MRPLLLLLLLFIFNSCNSESGVERNYIISQTQTENQETNDKE